MTEADLLFERFCADRGVAIRRIPEGPRRTPDFEVRFGRLRIIVEVKQLTPNKQDRVLLERLRQGRAVAGYSNKARPCQSIRDGAKQLREYIAGRPLPGVVVLFDTMAGLLGYLDADSIAASLYGPEIFHFSVSDTDPGAARPEVKFVGASLGGGRVVTPMDNTSLSAVGVLRLERPADRIALTLFHNCHAAIPIAPDEFRISDVTHLAYRPHHTQMLPTWARA